MSKAVLNSEFDFDDIRPYRDDEVRGVLDRLSVDAEFLDILAGLKLPRLKRSSPGRRLARWLVGLRVRRVFARINTVHDFQQLISVHLHAHMQVASTGISVRGLAALQADQAYLFISNHRDIAMDPAMVNLVLDDHDFNTTRIAIGDNLLSKPFASDLMRINKSFIVKRSSAGRREKLAALKQLSAYIRHSVVEENCSIWIAQSEGRAKDGIDKTETAMLKMLALSKTKGQSFAQALAELRIVPVSISYELDPCDGDKTRELHALRSEGSYQKDQYEDLKSIYAGIMGDKGRIVVAFGEPVEQNFDTADQLAEIIDSEIISHYQLQAPHLIAYQMLHGTNDPLEQLKADLSGDVSESEWAEKELLFKQRLETIPPAEQDIFLAMYANPVVQALQLSEVQIVTETASSLTSSSTSQAASPPISQTTSPATPQVADTDELPVQRELTFK
ncbi:MAG: 1-acyl-sn-glycerol-3-phosphate acyltransferase [Porticoccaceae bacterium]|nr:1-acyl-sn-glycerol-3-phosphate acyltransferase [Porticoccaceae bacterium]